MNKFSTNKSHSVADSKKHKSHSAYRENKEITYTDNIDVYELISRDEMSDLSLPDEFLKAFPEMSLDKAHKYHARYLKVIATELLRNDRHKSGFTVSFSLEIAKQKCGTFENNKERHYIWYLFNGLQPIVNILERGNNMSKKLTSATVSDKYYDLLINSCDAEQIMEIWFNGSQSDSDVVYVPVDMTSLNHYIMNCDDALAVEGRGVGYVAKLKRNRRHASMISVVAQAMVDRGITDKPSWPHVPKDSEYGRRYYHGLSVQSVHKEVRRAALGSYTQYDLHAAVYAIKLMLVKDIYKEYGVEFESHFTNTKRYLEVKSAIRKQLAKHITSYPDPVRLVKQAITALGFGAKLQSQAWIEDDTLQLGAISDIIKNEADRNRFMADPWVAEFVAEQNQLTDIIYEYCTADKDLVEVLKKVPNMLSPSGKLKKNQVVAYMYQHTERTVMLSVFGDMNYTMDIHDAVVSKDKLDLLEIKTRLSDWSEWLKVEEEHFTGYYNVENDVEVMAHKAFIAQEERDAAAYYGTHTRPGKVWRERGNQSVDLNVRADGGAGSGEVIASHLWA